MTKYVAAAVIACGALLGASAQAAPTSPALVQAQIESGNAVQKVWHCRRWSGGWGCGGGGGYGYRYRRWRRWR